MGRFINADNYAATGQGFVGNNMFVYCNNNPVMYTDSLGMSPEWWQWTISGATVAVGVALIATGIGGVAGGALLCAGVNSIIGSYVSEATGGSSFAGWAGGMVTGGICGLGAGLGGNLLLTATEQSGGACLGTTVSAGAVMFSTGALGTTAGTMIFSSIDGKEIKTEEVIKSAVLGGTSNLFAGIASGIGSAIVGMPAISGTTKVIANAIATGWSVISEATVDLISTIASWFS